MPPLPVWPLVGAGGTLLLLWALCVRPTRGQPEGDTGVRTWQKLEEAQEEIEKSWRGPESGPGSGSRRDRGRDLEHGEPAAPFPRPPPRRLPPRSRETASPERAAATVEIVSPASAEVEARDLLTYIFTPTVEIARRADAANETAQHAEEVAQAATQRAQELEAMMAEQQREMREMRREISARSARDAAGITRSLTPPRRQERQERPGPGPGQSLSLSPRPPCISDEVRAEMQAEMQREMQQLEMQQSSELKVAPPPSAVTVVAGRAVAATVVAAKAAVARGAAAREAAAPSPSAPPPSALGHSAPPPLVLALRDTSVSPPSALASQQSSLTHLEDEAEPEPEDETEQVY